jgi:hypothetical protein
MWEAVTFKEKSCDKQKSQYVTKINIKRPSKHVNHNSFGIITMAEDILLHHSLVREKNGKFYFARVRVGAIVSSNEWVTTQSILMLNTSQKSLTLEEAYIFA